MVDFLKRFYGEKFDPNSMVPYNVTFCSKHSDVLLRIVSEPNLPDLEPDGKTINFYFPKQYMQAANDDFETSEYHESVEMLKDYIEQWHVQKWDKKFSSDVVISMFQNFNRLNKGREWGSAMTTISCVVWYILDDFFEEKLALLCKEADATSVDLIHDYITNMNELYRDYHLEPKPRKWLVFPSPRDEKLWQWVWDVHCDYLERIWSTFNQKIKVNSPTWYNIFRDGYLRYFPGWRSEVDFIIRINNHPNGDFPDRYWSQVRSLCQAVYPMIIHFLAWDWHGTVDFTHWSCLEMDNWAAWQNDILSFMKEKVNKSPENIIFRELKRRGDITDSQAMAYGVRKAKCLMLEVLNHSFDSHMNAMEKAYIDEYIRFSAAAMSHFLVIGRFSWEVLPN